MTDLQKFARKKGVAMGLIEPNEEEKAEMQQAQQQPDPTQALVAAEAAEGASAELEGVSRCGARPTPCSSSRRLMRWADRKRLPLSPMGWKRRTRSRRSARPWPRPSNLDTATAHMPEKLNIEAHNAGTNRLKALADRARKAFKGG
jgi:hypothetical protein